MPITRPRTPRTPPLYHGALGAAAGTGGAMLAVASFYLTTAALPPGLARLVIAQLVLAAVATAVVFHHHAQLDAANLPRAIFASLALRAPRLPALIGALLIGLTSWLPNSQLAVWVQAQLGGSAEVPALEELLRGPRLTLSIACLSLVPAFAEEIVFRGLWTRALTTRLGVTASCCLTALAFGSYHLSFAQWLPTTLLGGLLAWATLRSNSLWTAITLHAVNNAVATMMASGLVGALARPILRYPSASLVLAVTTTLTGILLVAATPPRQPRDS